MNKHYYFFGFDMRRPLHVEADSRMEALAQLVHHLESKGRLGWDILHTGCMYTTDEKPKQSSKAILKTLSHLPVDVNVGRFSSSKQVIVSLLNGGHASETHRFTCPEFVVEFDGGHSRMRAAS